MKDFKILRLFDRFEKIFLAIDVDYPIMRRILQVKLTMDSRRVSNVMVQYNKKEQKSEKNLFISSLWIYLFFGLFMIPFLFISDDYIYGMSIIFGIFMFMIMTSLISDFSSVLLDIRDKNIMMTKPVNSRTINTAKGLHIFIYLFFLSISLAAGVLITSIFHFGVPFFLLLFLEIILMDLLIITLTVVIYTLILKYFDGEKLKDVINYVQIGLSLVITIGFQLVSRLFSIIDLQMVFTPKWWQFLIPPVWFGGPFQLLFYGENSISYILFSLLTFIVPLIAITVFVQLMPIFEKNLLKLNEHTEKKRKYKTSWKGLSKLICTSKEEQVFYRFTSSMIKKEREFKLKVYPALGFSFIFPYLFFINQLQMQSIKELAQGNGFLNLYFSAIMIPTVITMLKHSGNYQGAWIYKTMPITKSKPIFTGTIKAFLVQLLFPILVLNSTVFMMFFGVRIAPHLIAILLNFVLLTLITFSMLDCYLPFSVSFNDVSKESGKIMLLLLIGGGIVILHYISIIIPYGLLIYVIILTLVDIYMWNKIFNISWNRIKKSYQ